MYQRFQFLELVYKIHSYNYFFYLWAGTIDATSSLRLTLYNKWQQEVLRNYKTKEDHLGTQNKGQL